MKKPFTAEFARQWLSYDADSGTFMWIAGKTAGKIAGSMDGKGYRQITLSRNVLKAHRLAWLMTYGEWPSGHIDHVNHVTDDNRICNLRDVSRTTNAQNQVHAQRDSKTGFLGVKQKDGRYEARIGHNKKRIALGSFGSAQEAHSAYLEAKRALHAGCTI